jgi:hypothetical protein
MFLTKKKVWRKIKRIRTYILTIHVKEIKDVSKDNNSGSPGERSRVALYPIWTSSL